MFENMITLKFSSNKHEILKCKDCKGRGRVLEILLKIPFRKSCRKIIKKKILLISTLHFKFFYLSKQWNRFTKLTFNERRFCTKFIRVCIKNRILKLNFCVFSILKYSEGYLKYVLGVSKNHEIWHIPSVFQNT